MQVNAEDHKIIKNFIESYLSQIDTFIELIIRPECNQKCEYCYIYRYGEELYPIEERKTNNEILNNIKIFLDYLISQKYYIKKWELFAGDLFYDNLCFLIFDIFYEYFKIVSSINNGFNENIIIIPCNFSFCHDVNKINTLKKYVDKFKKINVNIVLSYSHDGKYSIDVREKQELSDEFYDNVFNLLGEYDWGAHPMIAPQNVAMAIKNYDWWIEQYNKYIISKQGHTESNFMPAFLEVRDDGWTNENIKDYLLFLNHIIEHRYQMFDYNSNLLMKHLFFPFRYLEEHNMLFHTQDILSLVMSDNHKGCNLGNSLNINCATLSFVPCHRTSYKFFTGGHFIIENNKIIDIQALEGINGYFNQISAPTLFNLQCYGCENRDFCAQGCRGAQFEYNLETYMPIPSVCKLMDAKLTFLVYKYHKLDIFNELFKQTEYPMEEGYKIALLKLLNAKGLPEYEYKYGNR